jgi:hypothetical protein
MELAHTHTPHQRARIGLQGLARIMSVALKTGLVLLVVSCIGAGVAVRTNTVPPFDWQLTPDGQHILAIHDGPVCEVMPGIGAGACADYLPDLREFTISYRTLQANWVLVSAVLPER